MKKYILSLTLQLATGAIIMLSSTSCDKIAPKDRWIPAPIEFKIDPTTNNTILVEEYTGQNCVNCPSAAEILEKIKTKYPKNIIVVGIHSSLSLPPFKTADAEEFITYFKLPSSMPLAMINRSPIPSTSQLYSVKYANWLNIIPPIMEQKKVVELSVKAAIEGNTVTVSVDSKAVNSAFKGKNLKLNLMMVEDGIKGYQALHGSSTQDYKHDHVFRGMLGGHIWGEDYAVGQKFSQDYPLPEKVTNAKNAYVVAFLSEDKGKIYQVAVSAKQSE